MYQPSTSVFGVSSSCGTDGTSLNINGVRTLNANRYTPTVSNTTNVTASTARSCHWFRIDNEVHVAGVVSVQTTAGTTNTILSLSLPVSSTLGFNYDLTGTAIWGDASNAPVAAFVTVDASNNAKINWIAGSAATLDLRFEFTYEVL